jgi:hypothetical protein
MWPPVDKPLRWFVCVYLAALSALVLMLVLGVAIHACLVPPLQHDSDALMKAQFETHRITLERLIHILRNDDRIQFPVRLGAGDKAGDGRGLDDLCRAAGIISIDHEDNTFRLTVSYLGWGLTYSAKGFLWSERRLPEDRLRSDLDHPALRDRTGRPRWWFARQIEDEWYLFYMFKD